MGLSFSSGGVGSAGHLAAELLNEAGKIHMRHVRAAPALIDLATGTVDVMIAGYSSSAPQILSGKVLPVAVTSSQPSAAYSGIPTMSSAVPGYSASIWYGLFGPSGLSADMVNRLNHEVNEIATSPELRKLTEADGALPVLASPAALGRLVEDDYKT